MTRYNLAPAVSVDGDTAPGYSSGQSLTTMEKLASETLPRGYTTEWTGIAYQQRYAGNTAGLGTPFSPSYSYSLDATGSLASSIMSNAGPK